MQNRLRNSVIWTVFALLIITMVMSGCGEMKGDIDENIAPNVKWATVPKDSSLFDFAPIIYWTGNDPDGFVKFYSYADITDAEAIDDPLAYIDNISDEAWKDTLATQAQIFLLTEEGDTTEHIFYIRCTDNEGKQCEDIKYRTFFRTNNAPNIPRIGPSGSDETLFDTRFVVSDTLFSPQRVTYVHPGIQFSWRGSDPDDKALYKIPLEYKAALVKAPLDTIFVTQWVDQQEATLTGLETGYYTLNVWARDDGLTESVAPARVEFNVISPTFENNLLVLIETPFIGNFAVPVPDSLSNFYRDLLTEVAPNLEHVDLEFDDIDVKFISQTSFTEETVVSRKLLSQYKMLITTTDQFNYAGDPIASGYLDKKNQLLEDYLRVGGRVWMMGRMVAHTALDYSRTDDGVVFGQSELMMLNYFGVEDIVYPGASMPYAIGPKCLAEWIGTTSGVIGLSGLDFDSSKAEQNFPTNDPFGYADNNYGQSGVDPIARTPGAQTTQYFTSRTAGLEIEILDENTNTIEWVHVDNDSIPYPPSSTRCYLRTDNPNINSVSKVINQTFRDAGLPNWEGEVLLVNNDQILVSYEEGTPWSNSEGGNPWNGRDEILVDYKYDPISEKHLKPCEVRTEGLEYRQNAFTTLRFRTALSSFSYYFVKREGAVSTWTQMLDWFTNPVPNTQIYGDEGNGGGN